MKTRGVTIVVLLAAACSNGPAGVGTWRNYTSMRSVRAVTHEGATTWVASSGGLFAWNFSGETYELYTNAEGLLSTDLTAIAIDRVGTVWSGTAGGVMHAYARQSKTWRYILDITNTSQTNKRINDISAMGDSLFVSTDFGLSVYRIGAAEFGDTYSRFGSLRGNVRVSVWSSAIFNDSIWLAVSDNQSTARVAVAGLANPNLLPPEAWELRVVDNSGVVPRRLAVFHHRLYAATTAGVYSYQGGSWTPVAGLSGQVITGLSASPSLLAITTPGEAYTLDTLERLQRIGGPLPSQAVCVASGAGGNPIIGTADRGILTFDTAWVSRSPNGPNSNQFLSVTVNVDGTVWAASGFNLNGKGITRFNGRDWKSFTSQNTPLPTDDYYRISTGCGGSVWASAYGRGIVEIPGGTDSISVSRIYGRNIGLIGIPADTNFIVTSTVACDGRGNTWFTVVDAADKQILVVRTAGGTWRRIPVYLNGVPFRVLQDRPIDRCLAVDPFGSLWAGVRQDGLQGVITLGNRGSIDDTTVAYHLTSNDGLPDNNIRTVVADLEGQIWVGTDRGIGIIIDPQNPRRAGGTASYKPLLGTVVNCLAVDALNQKWVGTPEGVIVLSPDGTQQVASYTVASTGGKLIDNDIKSIAIDGNTGTVYFGTLSGLASLTTVAAAPRPSFDKLDVSPNPYLIPNTTPITIDGLVESTTLKILTIDGRLVRQIKSPGGRVGFWDGRDEKGDLVATGVYIVVASSDKEQTVAKAKIAVVRR